jgi:hypothetical protein
VTRACTRVHAAMLPRSPLGPCGRGELAGPGFKPLFGINWNDVLGREA